MEDYFRELSTKLLARLHASEILLINFDGEDSDFVRLNRNKIRQAGCVRQQELRLDLIEGARQATVTTPLSGDMAEDLGAGTRLLDLLRQRLGLIPDNPFISYAQQPCDTRDVRNNVLPSPQAAVEAILLAGEGLDLVGIWASGRMARGFANSLGQFNWHSQSSFNFDWSIYHQDDRAVKQNYAGTEWNDLFLRHKLDYGRETLAVLARPPRPIKPGQYRVFLSPSAVYELLSLLNWGGFGLKSHRTLQTPLIRLIKKEARLHSRVTLRERHVAGLAPRFTRQGYIKPDEVELISQGQFGECLANAQSAKEYGAAVNCALEHPESLYMAGGNLHQDRILAELGTGVFVSNLWYCNYSDRNHCRITGMTRFATLWVEDGKPVAPLAVMRFDESLYHCLGDKLVDLTQEHEHILDTSTYERRSEASAMLPGALVDDFTFTL